MGSFPQDRSGQRQSGGRRDCRHWGGGQGRGCARPARENRSEIIERQIW